MRPTSTKRDIDDLLPESVPYIQHFMLMIFFVFKPISSLYYSHTIDYLKYSSAKVVPCLIYWYSSATPQTIA